MAHAATDTNGVEDIVAFFRRVYGESERRAGREEGFEEGRRQGRVASARRFLLKLLQGRGIALTSEQAARLEQCDDAERLEGWCDRLMAGETWEGCLADSGAERG